LVWLEAERQHAPFQRFPQGLVAFFDKLDFHVGHSVALASGAEVRFSARSQTALESRMRSWRPNGSSRPLPLRRADRSTGVHAQGKISAPCFFRGNFSATPCHLMFRTRLCSGKRDAEPSAEAIRRRNCAAEKPHPAARKNCAQRVAFGLPQDSHMQLMFEACVNRGSGLSAFRGAGFYVERGVARPARRPECAASD
jgi:hypothetical protein